MTPKIITGSRQSLLCPVCKSALRYIISLPHYNLLEGETTAYVLYSPPP